MVLQLLISFAPFLALVYALFALVQALRHKQQGLGALLLALVVLVVPLGAYFAVGAGVQEQMLTRFALGALIVFAASLLVGLVERRNKARPPGRSYGMVGIGVSVMLALAMFAAPLVQTAVSGTEPTATAQAVQNQSELASGDDTFVNVALNSSTDGTNAQATPAGDSETAEPTAAGLVVTEQTGLTVDEVTAQVSEGSTIAELVMANEGDLNAVIEAIAAVLDEMTAAGGMQAQMLSRMGADMTEIATQFVNGELGQAQNFLLPVLLTGEMPQFGGPGGNGGGAPPSDGSFTPPDGAAPPEGFDGAPPNAEATTEAESDFTVVSEEAATETTSESAPVRQPRDTAPQSTPEPTAIPDAAETAEASEPVIRPTRIAFPTATPMPEATEMADAESTEESGESSADAETVSTSTSNGATCMLVVNYNLNLRDQPTQDGSTVLVSIPFGTTVNADAVTEDGWYSVSYDGNSGWVTGEYVTAASSCANLPVGG